MKRFSIVFSCLSALLVSLAGCHQGAERSKAMALSKPDACALALAAQAGEERAGKIDEQIGALQQMARSSHRPGPLLEQLGQRFIAKARLSNDPGYYRLAEQCAQCLEFKDPGNVQALLLQGHVLHQLHRFQEAESFARRAVSRRGSFLDYGLLGDALMEQGKLPEAARAYQKMMDIKPFYQSYARAAHVRWLRGDLTGATALMAMAVAAASPEDPESVAWAYSRLALFQLQAGLTTKALKSCDAALTFLDHYPGALLVAGRALLAQGKTAQAIESLRRAAAANPLPEYQWSLADALRAGGREDEARSVETQLREHAALTDPRTFALYLATRGQEAEKAIQLARQELENRKDIFTWDALAWSLAAAGRAGEARQMIQCALSEGTMDARLFYHAGVIAYQSGHRSEARRWLGEAKKIEQMLLPSEQKKLNAFDSKGGIQ
jgi:tetratricopeptide (TPR) repeat protein